MKREFCTHLKGLLPWSVAGFKLWIWVVHSQLSYASLSQLLSNTHFCQQSVILKTLIFFAFLSIIGKPVSWTCWESWDSVSLAELTVPDLNSVICCTFHFSLCMCICCSHWQTGLCNFIYLKVLLCRVFKVLYAKVLLCRVLKVLYASISCFYWDLRHGLLWKPESKRNFWSKLKINMGFSC